MKKIHIIAGPTASGKSARALALAESTGGVIINADSQQLFKDLPILTARPTKQDEARAPHKLYGLLNANESPSAGKWLKWAKMEIDWALAECRLAIVVGGTGLYLKALTKGLAEIPDIDTAVTKQAANDYEAMGKAAFEERLKVVDPLFFERLKVYDKQRLIRAYGVWLGSGKPLTYWQQQEQKPFYSEDYFEIEKIEAEREELYQRCDQRFDKMIEMGAVEEVREFIETRQLAAAGLEKIIGFRELSAYLRGELVLEQAIDKAKQMTRNYAKRQMTWFRHQLS
ncbi:MAG: tRNA (adenosine(37)-N6)-dimethylallyltransferase MiaA [Alphaproteobacteria bacterium]|nr:tRNA (adenosine(37)-N6)-dimethylallyltransferase MiaA [Alphaproteobacteria bacterium]